MALLIAVHQPWAIFLSFCALGAGNSGYMMSQQTMVLEFGERADVAMRLALSTTIEGMISCVGPLIGGVVATTLGYGVLMSFSLAFLAAAFLLLVFKVSEPRRRVRAAASPAAARA